MTAHTSGPPSRVRGGGSRVPARPAPRRTKRGDRVLAAALLLALTVALLAAFHIGQERQCTWLHDHHPDRITSTCEPTGDAP